MSLKSRLLPLVLTALLGACSTAPVAPSPATLAQAPRTTGVAAHAMVAAANPMAVDAGLAVLRRGGSAVDAAVAVQMMLGVVEPQSSGIGGGGFMLVHDAGTQRLLAYDGRETAPGRRRPTASSGTAIRSSSTMR